MAGPATSFSSVSRVLRNTAAAAPDWASTAGNSDPGQQRVAALGQVLDEDRDASPQWMPKMTNTCQNAPMSAQPRAGETFQIELIASEIDNEADPVSDRLDDDERQRH